ncbi:hypothetical protein [Paenibacillus sp. GCM10027626]|uniref:hypothetical protein n=1 Tax=Paenibacillus sp. GCM10027626 TaxID=3273411 RepID=UPI003626CCB9
MKSTIQAAMLLAIIINLTTAMPNLASAHSSPELDRKAKDELQALARSSGATFRISWNEQTGTPSAISGRLTSVSRHTTEWIATQFIARNKHLFGLKSPEKNMKIKAVKALPGGTRTVHLERYLFDTPVYGDYIKLTIDVQGVVTAVESLIYPQLEKQLFNRPAHSVLSSEQAIRKAQAQLSPAQMAQLQQQPTARLYYLPFRAGLPLVYEVTFLHRNQLFAERMWIHAVMGHSLDPAL